MIDFTVAYDKLAQFETANEIAEYLKDCGIKANKREPNSCAISMWMNQQTGLLIRTGTFWTRVTADERGNVTLAKEYLTDAMTDFVIKFDKGKYPELVNGFE